MHSLADISGGQLGLSPTGDALKMLLFVDEQKSSVFIQSPIPHVGQGFALGRGYYSLALPDLYMCHSGRVVSSSILCSHITVCLAAAAMTGELNGLKDVVRPERH